MSAELQEGEGERYQALLESLQALHEPLELEAILQTLVDSSCKLFKADRCGIYLLDPASKLLSCPASRGLSSYYLQAVRGHMPWPLDVASKPEPVLVPDAPKEFWELREVISQEGVRTILFLPLFHRELLGKLAIYHDRPRMWRSEEIKLAQLLADQAVLAITKARLFEKEKRWAQSLEEFQTVGLQLTAQHELPQLLQLIVETAARLLHVRGGALYLVDEATDELELVVSYNLGKDKRGLRLKRGEGMSGRVWQTGQPLVVEDYSRWEGRSQKWADVAVTSVLAVPLLHRGRVIGVLNATDVTNYRKFGAEDVRLLMMLAGQAAMVIERGQGEQLQRTLLDIGTEIIATTDISSILRSVVQAITRHSAFKLAAISLFKRPIDPSIPHELHEITDLFIAGLSEEDEKKLRELAASGKLISCWDIVRKGRRLGPATYYLKAEEMPELIEKGVPGKIRVSGAPWGPYDTIYLLLQREGKVIGRISVADPIHGRPPTEDELAPLELLVNMAALALEKARREREIQQALEEVKSLNGFVRVLNEAQSLQELMETIIRHGMKLIPKANAGNFLLLNERTGCFEFKAAVGRDLAALQKAKMPEAEVLRFLKLNEGPMTLTRTLQRQNQFFRKLEQLIGPPPASTLTLPIKMGGLGDRVIAVLNLNNLEEEGVFDQQDLRKIWGLMPEVELVLRRMRDQEQLRELSLRDPLTGAYNRRYFLEAVQKEQACARRFDYSFALLMLDINHFYEFNDRFGHLLGDKILCELTQVLMRNVRDSDSVVRYGGEEFIILMPKTSCSQAERVMARLQKKIAEHDFAKACGLDEKIKLTVSMGLAVWSPKEDQTLEEIIEEADRWVYRRKRRAKATKAKV